MLVDIFMELLTVEPAAETQTRFFSACLDRLSAQGRVPLDDTEGSPELMLRALWFAAHGRPCSLAQAESLPLPPLSLPARLLEDLVERLAGGAHVAHLTRRCSFMGLELMIGPEALVPQKETELLATIAVEFLSRAGGQPTAIDVCTGSGNLALALACHVPGSRVWASDLSPGAVALARQNALHLQVNHRVEVFVGDLFAPIEKSHGGVQVDLIVCNPPYISSAKVDALKPEVARSGPRLAFDGGPFGLNILSRLINESPRFLKPGGYLCFEVGAGQGPCLLKLMKTMSHYSEVRTASDPQGVVRVLIGRT